MRVNPDQPIGSIISGKTDIAPFTIGMVQTVHNRLDNLDPGEFDLLVVDEAHHAMSKTWRKVADHFQTRLRLGLSATPSRLDGADLSNLFSNISYEFSLIDAVKEKYLAPPLCYQIRTKTRLDDVKKSCGDFKENELAYTVNTPARNNTILEVFKEKAENRKTLGFTVGVGHAKALASIFKEAGLSADWVSGDDPMRNEKIDKFRSGEIQIIFNAMLLTEGFDQPDIDCILMARPTMSRVLYTQMVGRGLRLSEKKENCLIVDFVDNTSKHQLWTAWELFGQCGRMSSGVIVDPFKEHNDKEARIRAFIAGVGKDVSEEWVARIIDLLNPPPKIGEFEYGKYGWHHEPASRSQIWRLVKMGYDVESSDWTKGQASAVIGQGELTSQEKKELADLRYDIFSYKWTRQHYNAALGKFQ